MNDLATHLDVNALGFNNDKQLLNKLSLCNVDELSLILYTTDEDVLDELDSAVTLYDRYDVIDNPALLAIHDKARDTLIHSYQKAADISFNKIMKYFKKRNKQ